MTPRMKKFLARPPKRITPERVQQRRTKSLRRGGRPARWLDECCNEQGWRCAYCKRNMSRKSKPGRERLVATLDHKVALVKGGRNSRDNVVAACLGCNQDKSDMTVEQFAEWRASRAASLRALAEMGE